MNIDEATLEKDLLKFALECPYSGGNPDECQIHDLRTQPLDSRAKFISKLALEEKQRIYNNHETCLQDKKSESLFN